MSGLFLSLDGCDGTGKSTQCRLLAERLRELGKTVTLCADPGGTELGAKLRELLLFGREHQMAMRTEALLFLASRAELVQQVIRPALERREIVISDRFTLANVVYQGHAGGLNPAEIRSAAELSTGGLEPDRTLVLDVSAEIAAMRRKPSADRLEGRGEEYFQRVRKGFLLEVSRNPERLRPIDASGDLSTVQSAVWAAVQDLFP